MLRPIASNVATRILVVFMAVLIENVERREAVERQQGGLRRVGYYGQPAWGGYKKTKLLFYLIVLSSTFYRIINARYDISIVASLPFRVVTVTINNYTFL